MPSTVIPDRSRRDILIAAAMTRGKVRLETIPSIYKSLGKLEKQRPFEHRVEFDVWWAEGMSRHHSLPPGFCDHSAVRDATLAQKPVLSKTIYSHRFGHVEELRRMGADIQLDSNSAVVRGVKQLSGASVRAMDLRAGAALVIAGLAAHGTTEVSGIEHIMRGYEKMISKLKAVGARIVQVD